MENITGKGLIQAWSQPFRGFLLKLIHLHSMEHIKGAFLSIEAEEGIMQLPTGENGTQGQQIL